MVLNSIFFKPVTAEDIKNIIASLKNKPCNNSEFPICALKYVSGIVSEPLALLINQSLADGIFPQSLKVARVVPIFKGGCGNDANNYRPVSVLPLFSKIYERVVFNQLSAFLDKYNIINEAQYGFRAGKSTIEAILNHLQFVYDELDSGNLVISLFLDFRKAFDSINHEILLKKLHHYGIRGLAHKWFSSYLSNRQQFVSINGVCSGQCEVSYGVPQGSILGPILFLLFINDFPKCNPFFKYTLFADDTTLSCSFNSCNI